MNKRYVGITIGPIFDTINETNKPVALWFASILFSDITRRLCIALTDSKAIPDINIISPYFDKNAKYTGVGKYHDRIIFSTGNFNYEVLSEIVRKVKRDTINEFPEEYQDEEHTNFLEEYIQIHFVAIDANEVIANPIIALSPYLDAIELTKTCPRDNSKNLFKELFGSEKINALISEIRLFQNIPDEQNLFQKNKKFRSIEDIACPYENRDQRKFKFSKYFALVNADGDNMGKLLEKLTDEEAIKEFSNTCLQYAQSASDVVAAYGGMPIYAGGDDLLFLAPVKGKNDKDIIQLCDEIHHIFDEKITQKYASFNSDEPPTVSFGVSIQYKKFPLYEATVLSYNMLCEAKGKGKNSVVINLQKHSGQSVKVLINNKNLGAISSSGGTSLFSINPGLEQAGAVENLYHSFIYKLNLLEPMIYVMDSQGFTSEQYREAFKNNFDNIGQENFQNYIAQLSDFYCDVIKAEPPVVTAFLTPEEDKKMEFKKKDEIECKKRLIALEALLRIKKFMVERGDEKNG